VRGKSTLEESLDLYVQGELMEGDNHTFAKKLAKRCATECPCTTCMPLQPLHQQQLLLASERCTRDTQTTRALVRMKLTMFAAQVLAPIICAGMRSMYMLAVLHG